MGARGLIRARAGLALPGALALTVGIAEAIGALDTARTANGSVAERAIDGLWAVRIGDLVWCAAGLAALVVARPGGRARRIARGAGLATAALAGAIAIAALASGLGAGEVDPDAVAVGARIVAGGAAALLLGLLVDRLGHLPEPDSDLRWRPPASEPAPPDAAGWLARGEQLMVSDLAFSPRRDEALRALAALREAAVLDDPREAQEAYDVLERMRH